MAAPLSTGDPELDLAIAAAGYRYDPGQNIFFSRLNAWQRNFGYFRLYDELLAPLHMILDCEPIYFQYAGKRWLIEFWKGQYAMVLGCEIGVYNTDREDIEIPGIYSGPFFDCAGDQDLLEMACTLYHHDKPLFTRRDRHWWLTGFILGGFANPEELTMEICLTLKDGRMLAGFSRGLEEAGYDRQEYSISGTGVSLCFDIPRTPQPGTRNPDTDRMIQWKNKMLCDLFVSLTKDKETMAEKINTILRLAPGLYEHILELGKNKQLFGQFGRPLTIMRQQK